MQRVLRRYGREEQRGDCQIYSRAVKEDQIAEQLSLKELVDPFTGEPVKKS